MNPIQRIEIFTWWIGFADPPSRAAKLVIVRGDDRFIREQFPEEKVDQLSQESVHHFQEALSRPLVPQLTPERFDLPEGALRRHYDSCWTDDHPSHLVRVIFSNGRIVDIRTSEQHAFMLPLTVNDSQGLTGAETFDPQLSRAIAALMPSGYLEKDRLEGRLGILESNILENSETIAQPIDEPIPDQFPDGDGASDASASSAAFDEILRILNREESPKEKAEAELSGKTSERLLKRIPLRDFAELLENGADPKIADDVGQTALMHAAFPPFNREKFRLLVRFGADLEAHRNDGYTGLHLACAGGEATAAEEWIRAGSDINSRTPEEATPLMLASSWLDIVRLLLPAGVDVNAVDEDGHAALVYAILKQSWIQADEKLEAIRAIIRAGANVNLADRNGISPLGHARRVLKRIQLEKEVTRAFNPNCDTLELGDYDDLRMAVAVVELIESAGGIG